MTAVDWFPASPRFQLSYHLLSHAFKERIRLRVLVDEPDPIDRLHHPRLARRQLLRARGLRPLRHPLRRPSRPAPHHDARRLEGPPAAQGLSGGGIPLMSDTTGTPVLELPQPKARASQHMVLNMGPQHPATHGVLRLVVEIDGEIIVQRPPRDRLPAHRHRKDLRGQVLPAGGSAHRPHQLPRSALQQSLLLPGRRKAARP